MWGGGGAGVSLGHAPLPFCQNVTYFESKTHSKDHLFEISSQPSF